MKLLADVKVILNLGDRGDTKEAVVRTRRYDINNEDALKQALIDMVGDIVI